MHPIDFGVADIEPDPNRTGAWILRIDGIAQSYVDLVDPRFLEFRYMRRIAAVLDTAAPGGRPLRVLHLGGGAYSLPRYVAASRPGSRAGRRRTRRRPGRAGRARTAAAGGRRHRDP